VTASTKFNNDAGFPGNTRMPTFANHKNITVMRKSIFLFIIVFCSSGLSRGQQHQKENPFSFEASYIGDGYANAAGGLRTGAGYMGMGNIKMGFDTGRARWWKGGSFFVNGASIHGKSLTENFSGDLQVASNIDAGTHVYMHELWFRQEFDRFSFTVGLQDLNSDFLTGDNAGEFINGSFGVIPVVSGNVPLPIFPLTGLGISARWDIDDRFALQAAVFDGCQTPLGENNPHNLHWSFSSGDGMFAATELHSKFHIKGMEGTYKLGAYYHSGLIEFDEETRTSNTVFKHNYGFYVIADQTVFERGNRKIGVFTQVGIAPENQNLHSFYAGFGVNCYGIFSTEGRDVMGLAVATLDMLRSRHSRETALELHYKYQLNDNIAIQPDIQYIIDPSGTAAKLPDALIGILRIHIGF
jgi:porin